MFSQACIIPSVHGGEGGCMHGEGGCAWQKEGVHGSEWGMHSERGHSWWGACMAGGCVWWWGACVAEGMQPLQWMVHILLECILDMCLFLNVLNVCCNFHTSRLFNRLLSHRHQCTKIISFELKSPFGFSLMPLIHLLPKKSFSIIIITVPRWNRTR